MQGVHYREFEGVPEQCRKCPVLGRYAFMIDMAKLDSKKATTEAFNNLDKIEPEQNPHLKNLFRQVSEHETEMSEIAFGAKDIYEQQTVPTLIENIDPDCPGSKRGSGEPHIFGFLSYIMGERTCQNPGFSELQSDREIAIQLRMNNWHPEDQ